MTSDLERMIGNIEEWSNDDVTTMLIKLHEHLHHFIKLHQSRVYFDQNHSLATTSELDRLVLQYCDFCKGGGN